MQHDALETIIGAIVVAIAVAFLSYAYIRTDSGSIEGYEITAKFSRIDGITPGTDVRMSGIKIGTVDRQELDLKTYMAVLHMSIKSDVVIPDDSSIKISAEGLLGGNYINVEPGGSFDALESGGEIIYTQGSIDLMGLLGQAVFAVGGKNDNSD